VLSEVIEFNQGKRDKVVFRDGYAQHVIAKLFAGGTPERETIVLSRDRQGNAQWSQEVNKDYLARMKAQKAALAKKRKKQ